MDSNAQSTLPEGGGPYLVLIGNGPYSNRGCEAIVRGTSELFRRHFPHPKFISCSSNPAARADVAGEIDPAVIHKPLSIGSWEPPIFVKRTLRKLFPKLIAKYGHRPGPLTTLMATAHCAMEIGGDNYSLDYGVLPLPYMEMDRRVLAAGKPVVLFGCSIGPFSANPEFEATMRDHLRAIPLLCVRETETVKYLASIGIEENVVLGSDPAFAMRPKQPDLPDELMKFIEKQPVGLNFSTMVANYIPVTAGGWLNQVVACVEAVLESAESVLLVPHVTQPGNDDHDLLARAARALPPALRPRVAVLPATLTAAEYKWCIGRTKVFAGARTHSTIAGVSSCVPTLMVGYSMKARGLAKDVYGSDEWLIPIQKLEPKEFGGQVARLLKAEPALRSHLTAMMPAYTEKAFAMAGRVADLIDPERKMR